MKTYKIIARHDLLVSRYYPILEIEAKDEEEAEEKVKDLIKSTDIQYEGEEEDDDYGITIHDIEEVIK